MTRDEIRTLSNFSYAEKDVYDRKIFGQYEGVSFELMQTVDGMVSLAKNEYPGTKFIVHDINMGKHGLGSKHYDGKAIDGHLEGVPLRIQFMLAIKAGFTAIGGYGKGIWKAPGIHADIRDQDYVSMWICMRHFKGAVFYEYDFREICYWLTGGERWAG